MRCIQFIVLQMFSNYIQQQQQQQQQQRAFSSYVY